MRAPLGSTLKVTSFAITGSGGIGTTLGSGAFGASVGMGGGGTTPFSLEVTSRFEMKIAAPKTRVAAAAPRPATIGQRRFLGIWRSITDSGETEGFEGEGSEAPF